LFLKLKGPELLRLRLADIMPAASTDNSIDTAAASLFVREWAQLWTKPGSGLTTPVQIVLPPRVGGGSSSERVLLLFKPTFQKFVSAKEEKAEAAAREKGNPSSLNPGSSSSGSKTLEGGLEFIVETEPEPRIRVVRAPLSPGAAVKEMSEALILSRFQRDIKALLGK
jgi:hypothetical protein